MALTEIIFGITNAKIGVVELDASIRELHRGSATVTRHPIEAEAGSQSSVSDHVHVDPISIQIEGMVTNTPAEWLAGITGTEENRDIAAHQELLDDLLTGRLVTIVTTLLEYPNMVLESLEVARDAAKGNALHLSANATMVRLVTLSETEGAIRPVSNSTRNGGRTATEGADTATAEAAGLQSAAFKAIF